MLTKTDLKQIREIVHDEVKSEVTSSEKRINKKIDKLERKMDYAINFLDRDYLKLLQRVERIEEHLNIESSII